MQKNIKKTQRFLTVSITVVALLLLVNIFLLLFLNGRLTHTAGVDGNVIGDTQVAELPALPTKSGRLHAIPMPMRLLSARGASEKLSLNLWNGYEGEKAFELTNMFPGDSETKEYKVTVRSRDAIALSFAAEITQNSALSRGLVFTVVANGEPLYHGAISEMPVLSVALTSGSASQEVVYKITAELPISANNDYARLSLSVNFLWTLSENEPEETTTKPEETTTKPAETTTKPEETTRPKPPVTEPEPIETDPVPEETTTVPEETTTVPEETTTVPEETTTEPEETTTEPEETTTVPEETTAEPPETGPTTPAIPDPCKLCAIDRVIENIFGKNGERCVICDAITSLFSASEQFCICPIGCLIVVVVGVVAVVGTVTLIVYRVLRKRKEEKSETENNQ